MLRHMNLMYHCGISMEEDSLIFPSPLILPKILEGNYGKPIKYDDPQHNNFDGIHEDIEYDQVDERVDHNFGLGREEKRHSTV